METQELVNRIIEDMRPIMKNDYQTPEQATGNCANASYRVALRWDYQSAFEMVYTVYLGDEDAYEYDYPGLCIDHYAVLINDETVIDYTLHQFFPQFTSPAVLPKDEWCALFDELWEENNDFEQDKSICICRMGLGSNYVCNHPEEWYEEDEIAA